MSSCRSRDIQEIRIITNQRSLHTHSISPSLPSNSVLLRTLATPINPADVNQIQGVYPSKPPFTSVLGTSEPSAVGGNEGCFEVLSVSPSISAVAKGDWVIMRSTGFGTWRTHALAGESEVLTNPRAASARLRAAERLDAPLPASIAGVSRSGGWS